MRLSGTVMEIWRLKDNGVTSLTFWGHVTSSVTWPFDSRWSTSYMFSIATIPLSSTVMEIWRRKDMNGRTTNLIISSNVHSVCLAEIIKRYIWTSSLRQKYRRPKRRYTNSER